MRGPPARQPMRGMNLSSNCNFHPFIFYIIFLLQYFIILFFYFINIRNVIIIKTYTVKQRTSKFFDVGKEILLKTYDMQQKKPQDSISSLDL